MGGEARALGGGQKEGITDKNPGHWPGSARLCDLRQVTALSGPQSEGLTREGQEQMIMIGVTAGGRGAKPGYACLLSSPRP